MELQCKFECTYAYRNFSLRTNYTCKIEDASIKEPGVIIKAFNGEHSFGRLNKSVEILRILNTDVHFLPIGIGELFPNLTCLEVVNCGLTEISRNDLRKFSNLEKLILSGNKLVMLPDDLFADTPKLNQICFNHNSLQRLSSKLLQPIRKNLVTAKFYRNPLFSGNYAAGENLDGFMKLLDFWHSPPLEVPKYETDEIKKAEEFFETGKFSDFTIKVGDKEYKVHKFMLALKSSVFEEMFTKDQDIQVFKNIKIFSKSAFEDFLRYFYNSEIRNEDCVLELFELAAEFNVPKLKSECEEIISKQIDKSNVIEIYNLGHLYDSHKLKQKAFAKIQNIVPGTSDDLIDEKNILNELIDSKRRFEKISHTSKSFKKYC